jgi:SAM-dependent methyltransferase
MKYDWKDAGEEWSEPWGSSAAQWSGAILPRLRGCLPAATILEIGAGFGRWTHYLRNHCERLLVLDRKEECIAACRERFSGDKRLTHFVNDGRSLSMLPDESIDFVLNALASGSPAKQTGAPAEVSAAIVSQRETRVNMGKQSLKDAGPTSVF